MNLQPIEKHQRIQAIDILRGLSLLGILLVNMFGFSLPMPHLTDLASWFTDVKDIMQHQLLDIYVQSSFYPLFSMLFGYGFMMQWMKAKQLNRPFYSFASKRIIILFILGMCHAFLIWWGDILSQYAFCAVFLILFLKLKSKYLVIIALILYAVFNAFILSLYIGIGIFSQEVIPDAVDIGAIQQAITAYVTGDWLATFEQRKLDLAVQLSPIMWFSSLFTILPYMMLGAAAAKWQLIENARNKMVFWICIAVIGLGVGIFIKSAPITFTRTYGLDYLKVYVGGPILTVGYIAVVVLICLVPIMIKLLAPIAKVGRMSLTMYLMQSIIATTLFYNWGMGLYGKLDVASLVMLALGIYIVQLLIASIWFTKFEQGPIEAMMKKIIYGKKLSEK